MLIYVVFGATGEYSDRREYAICAYRDQFLAQQHIERATIRANYILVESEKANSEYEYRRNATSEYDLNIAEMDYTGTRYFYSTIEVLDKLINEV